MTAEQLITEIIRIGSNVSVAFPLLAYFIRARYASGAVHMIGMLIVVSALSDISGYFLYSNGRPTVTLFNGYYIVLFILLAWFYYQISSTQKGRMTVIAGLIFYFIAYVFVSLYVQPFSQYQTFMWTITGMIMILFSISYFIHLFSARTMVIQYELLWINSGILLYFCLNLFLFVMSSYILTRLDNEISLLIWSFHNVNNVMKNVLFGCGIFAFSRERLEQQVPANLFRTS
jgi:hypothetical protein